MSNKRIVLPVICYLLAIILLIFAVWYLSYYVTELPEPIFAYFAFFGIAIVLWIIEGISVFIARDMLYAQGFAYSTFVPIAILLFFTLYSTIYLSSTFPFTLVFSLAMLGFGALSIVVAHSYPWSELLLRSLLPLLRKNLDTLVWVRDNVVPRLNSGMGSQILAETASLISEANRKINGIQKPNLGFNATRRLVSFCKEVSRKTQELQKSIESSLENEVRGLYNSMASSGLELSRLMINFFDKDMWKDIEEIARK